MIETYLIFNDIKNKLKLDFFSENGFIPYTNQVWVKYWQTEGKRKPILWASITRRGKILINGEDGQTIIISSDKEEVRKKLRLFFLDNLLN